VRATVAPAQTQADVTLHLPARAADALGGTEIARQLRDLDLKAREERVFREIAGGNIPDWLRTLHAVEMVRSVGGREYRVTFWTTSDYLAVGSHDDYFRVPLSPQTAQRIADLVDGSLPTPPMVDAIWASADLRLVPTPIAPSAEMTTVPVFEDHNWRVAVQRARHEVPTGALVAGHQKDIVLTPRLDAEPGRVAIYGWHRLDGQPIQPVYIGHSDHWVDYSHGIRIVLRQILIEGRARDIADVLRDETLADLVSGEGVIREPRYSTRPSGA